MMVRTRTVCCGSFGFLAAVHEIGRVIVDLPENLFRYALHGEGSEIALPVGIVVRAEIAEPLDVFTDGRLNLRGQGADPCRLHQSSRHAHGGAAQVVKFCYPFRDLFFFSLLTFSSIVKRVAHATLLGPRQ